MKKRGGKPQGSDRGAAKQAAKKQPLGPPKNKPRGTKKTQEKILPRVAEDEVDELATGPEAEKRHKAYLHSVGNAEGTLGQYDCKLRQLINFVRERRKLPKGDRVDLKTLTEPEWTAYLLRRTKKGIMNTGEDASALSKWAAMQHYTLPFDPTVGTRGSKQRSKKKKALKGVLTERMVESMLEWCKKDPQRQLLADAARLGILGRLRITEVKFLRTTNLLRGKGERANDPHKLLLEPRSTKTPKPDPKIVPDEFAEVWDEIVARRRGEGDYLFERGSMQDFRRNVQELMDEANTALELPKGLKWTTHIFRHTGVANAAKVQEGLFELFAKVVLQQSPGVAKHYALSLDQRLRRVEQGKAKTHLVARKEGARKRGRVEKA